MTASGNRARNGECPPRRFDTSDALAGNFVGGAVGRSARQHGNAAKHRDALIEAERLNSDLALVVEQRQHRVELTRAGTQEDSVGRKRPIDRNALRSTF